MASHSDAAKPLLEGADKEATSSGNAPLTVESLDPQHKLSKKMHDMGIYDEVQMFKHGYRQWRLGEAQGAKGEMTVESIRHRMPLVFYPNVATYNFRKTQSFWVAVAFIQGSIGFMWGYMYYLYAPATYDSVLDPKVVYYAMTKMIFLYACLLYLIGVYLGYQELINLGEDTRVDEGRPNYFYCNFVALHRDRGVALSSIAGWIFFGIGALFYLVGCVSTLFDGVPEEMTLLKPWEITPYWNNILCDWSYLNGGICFFLGGVAEVVHNEVSFRAPLKLEWWMSVADFFGGLGFWILACPDMLNRVFGEAGGTASSWVGFWSVVLYASSSTAAVYLWRGERFGLALISQLNDLRQMDEEEEAAAGNPILAKIGMKHTATLGKLETGKLEMTYSDDRQHYEVRDFLKRGTDDQPTSERISFFGIAVVLMCIICGVLQAGQVCLYFMTLPPFSPVTKGLNSPEFRRDLTSFVMSVLLLMGNYMIIVLKSAMVRAPTESPFRELMTLLLILVIVMTLNSIISLGPLWDLIEQFLPNN